LQYRGQVATLSVLLLNQFLHPCNGFDLLFSRQGLQSPHSSIIDVITSGSLKPINALVDMMRILHIRVICWRRSWGINWHHSTLNIVIHVGAINIALFIAFLTRRRILGADGSMREHGLQSSSDGTAHVAPSSSLLPDIIFTGRAWLPGTVR
jgi:hypothetical protein